LGFFFGWLIFDGFWVVVFGFECLCLGFLMRVLMKSGVRDGGGVRLDVGGSGVLV